MQEVEEVHRGVKEARLPDLVPFWKPPNSSEMTMRTAISSTIQSRQPLARDRGLGRRSRRPNTDLYISMDMPRHSAICRGRRII